MNTNRYRYHDELSDQFNGAEYQGDVMWVNSKPEA